VIDVVEPLQTLIRFDTTNPPGNEAECIGYLQRLLSEAGVESRIVARDDARPNLIERALRNTVTVTILHAGGKINVIPAEVEVELELDGRTLPGYGPDDLIRKLHVPMLQIGRAVERYGG